MSDKWKKIIFILVIVAIGVFVFYKLVGKNYIKHTYSNPGKNFSVTLDSYLSMKQSASTDDDLSNDFLDLVNGNCSISIQRYPISEATKSVTLAQFKKLLESTRNEHDKIKTDKADITINNNRIQESVIEYLSMTQYDTQYSGYVYYFKTDEAFYMALLTSSNPYVIEHYKGFVDDITFQ